MNPKSKKLLQNCLNNKNINESIPLLKINVERGGVMCVCIGLGY